MHIIAATLRLVQNDLSNRKQNTKINSDFSSLGKEIYLRYLRGPYYALYYSTFFCVIYFS